MSTSDQNLGAQTKALTEVGCERIFTEKASGAQRDRPELQKALEFARSGDVLVVWRLDRLARSLKQLIETVDDLSSRGIHLRSLTESIDTTTPAGKLVFHVFGALGEFERELIRERTMAGLQAAKALLKDDDMTVGAVAKRLGVSVPTLYRYLPAAASSQQQRG